MVQRASACAVEKLVAVTPLLVVIEPYGVHKFMENSVGLQARAYVDVVSPILADAFAFAYVFTRFDRDAVCSRRTRGFSLEADDCLCLDFRDCIADEWPREHDFERIVIAD
jgi:hypothetical protein